MVLYVIVLLVCAYLIGSIPTAIIVSKWLYKKDVRLYGSKNAGATNVVRVLGWKPGLFVLLFDIFKGYFSTVYMPLIISHWIPISYPIDFFMILAGFSAVFGHIWTVFAGFKGGKGVATGAGMLIGLAPDVVLYCILIFLITVVLFRMVSLGSIMAAISFPIILFLQKFAFHREVYSGILYVSLIIPLLIAYTHRSNIKRILNGTENKIQFTKRGS